SRHLAPVPAADRRARARTASGDAAAVGNRRRPRRPARLLGGHPRGLEAGRPLRPVPGRHRAPAVLGPHVLARHDRHPGLRPVPGAVPRQRDALAEHPRRSPLAGARHRPPPGAAGGDLHGGGVRGLSDGHALLDPRRDRRRLPHHRARQGPAGRRGAAQARRAERAAADDQDGVPGHREHRQRRDHHRDGLQLAGPGEPVRLLDLLPRPAHAPGPVRPVLQCDDPRGAVRGDPVLVHRPEDPEVMSTQERPVSPRAVAWARRRRAAARAWRDYRGQRGGMVGLAVLGVIVLLALAAPFLVDESALSVTQATGGRLEPPSAEFWLGTDESGRSVLALTLWGTRLSLVIGLTATVAAILIGTVVGVTSGHVGGWYGWVALRVSDWFMVLPSLVVAIALLAVLGRSAATTVAVIAIVSWSGTARLVRAQTLTVQSRPYLER